MKYFLMVCLGIFLTIGCESTIQAPNADASEGLKIDGVPTSHSGSTVYVDASASGSEDGSEANPFDTIQEGVDHANDNDVVMLESDFTLSSQVTINDPLTLDGGGNTVFASFAKSSNSNNSAISIIGTNDVTVSNLTIDGSGGTELHGINVYASTGVLVSDVSINDNDHTGLVVNGSEVTAHNISTSGHGWHAMNVDLGTGVDGPAELTVTGISSHSEPYPIPHIYIDDTSKDVSVDDVEGQYEIEESGNARAYYLVPVPETKDDCKKYGWEEYAFDNQGQCIQFVNTGKDSR